MTSRRRAGATAQLISSLVSLCLLAVPLAHVRAQGGGAADTARVRIGDLRGVEHSVNFAELRAMPRIDVTAQAHRDSGTYRGVKLEDVLVRFGAPNGDSLRGRALATYVVVEAADNYRVVFSLAEISSAFTDRAIVLAYEKDGRALSANEGPFRLVVPGERRPARWVRQVTVIRMNAVSTTP
jgi:hypothetical protein